MANVPRSELTDALSAVDFPAHKDDIVREAEQREATVEAQKALRSLPPVEYGSADEVIRSVHPEVGTGPGPHSDDPERQVGKPGVANRLR